MIDLRRQLLVGDLSMFFHSFKSLLERLKRDFDGSKTVSFYFSKNRRDRFKTAIISRWFEHVFTLKSLLERLKRDFDGSKTVSFQFTRNLWVSHFNMLFRSSQWFERRKRDSRLAKFCDFHLEGLF